MNPIYGLLIEDFQRMLVHLTLLVVWIRKISVGLLPNAVLLTSPKQAKGMQCVCLKNKNKICKREW